MEKDPYSHIVGGKGWVQGSILCWVTAAFACAALDWDPWPRCSLCMKSLNLSYHLPLPVTLGIRVLKLLFDGCACLSAVQRDQPPSLPK